VGSVLGVVLLVVVAVSSSTWVVGNKWLAVVSPQRVVLARRAAEPSTASWPRVVRGVVGAGGRYPDLLRYQVGYAWYYAWYCAYLSCDVSCAAVLSLLSLLL